MANEDDQLARVAYEAYRGAVAATSALGPWKDLSAWNQRAWIVVAQAVADRVRPISED